jgi:hypothetical protein
MTSSIRDRFTSAILERERHRRPVAGVLISIDGQVRQLRVRQRRLPALVSANACLWNASHVLPGLREPE